MAGVSFYKLRMVDFDGLIHYSGIESLNSKADSPIEITVFPNPLKIGQCIFVDLQTPRQLTDFEVSVWNRGGERVLRTTSADAEKGPGMHNIEWNASDMESGVYIYTLRQNGVELARKMVLIK